MCGIAGFIAPFGAEEARARLASMLASIAYRGPDECTGAAGDGFAIGTARLSIVDIAGGTQPAISDDGVFVVFNGEIFNYRQLRASLAAKGHTFRSNSEVEVLLHLYQQHGPAMAAMLNGQFAVAILDKAADTVHLFRDPFGIRPLFWWSNGRSIRFASEIKALLANHDFSVSLDPRALIQTVRFWTVVGEQTMFNDIKQVPPGHTLTWCRGKTSLRRYWDWPFSTCVEPLHLNSEAEYFEAFDDALAQAVKRQTMADVEVGAYISGGIDSSVIVHHLSALSGKKPLSTFSVAFDDPDYDESQAQEVVAQYYRTRHRVAHIQTADIARDFATAVAHAETPLFRSAPVPMYRLSNEVRAAGIKVVMSGEGADEILLGYDLFREAKVRRFWSRNPASRCRGQLLRRLYDYLPQYKNPRYFNLLLDFYRPTLTQVDDPHYAMAVRWNNGKALESCFSPDVHAVAAAHDPTAELERWLPAHYSAADDVERAQAIEAMTLLGNYLLSSQGDRMALANSVETRYPYLDLEFVRFAARLPRALKLRGLKDKFILRQTYAGELPEAVRNRKKFAYQAPEKKAFFPEGKLVEWAADLLATEHIARDGIFDPAYVQQYCLTPPTRDAGRQGFRNNMLFMIVLSSTIIIDRFIRARPSAAEPAPAQKLLIVEQGPQHRHARRPILGMSS
jgi:asparagine synthase (glutamine-hydrolysing)